MHIVVLLVVSLFKFIVIMLADHLLRNWQQVQMCRFIKLLLAIWKVDFVRPQFACVFNKPFSKIPFYVNKDMTQKKKKKSNLTLYFLKKC